MKENYCTLSPDTLFGVYIGDCCKEHDKQYQSDPKTKERAEVDSEFRNNIIKTFTKAGKQKIGKIVGHIYYLAVRIFCGPSWKRWNYHWFLGYIPIPRSKHQ